MGALVVDNLRVWIVTGAALAPVAKMPNLGPGVNVERRRARR